MTLMRHCAGSSARAIVNASQLGGKASFVNGQGSLHMRTLTPKKDAEKMGKFGGVAKVMEKRGQG